MFSIESGPWLLFMLPTTLLTVLRTDMTVQRNIICIGEVDGVKIIQHVKLHISVHFHDLATCFSGII